MKLCEQRYILLRKMLIDIIPTIIEYKKDKKLNKLIEIYLKIN